MRARVGDAAVREGEVLHARPRHRPLLHVRRRLAVEDALLADPERGVLEADALEGDVAHDLPARAVAREDDERRRGRHVGTGPFDALPRARDVEDLPRLHVVEPFARRVERGAEVLEHVAGARRAPEEERALHALLQDDAARRRVQRLDAPVAHVPALPDGDEDAPKLVRRQLRERRDVGRVGEERAGRARLVVLPHVVVEAVRRAGARGAAVPDPELVEGEAVRRRRLPDAVRAHRERRQCAAAVEDRRQRRGAPEAHGGVRRRERERLFEVVAPRRHPDLHGPPRHGARGAQGARPRERGGGRADLAVRRQRHVRRRQRVRCRRHVRRQQRAGHGQRACQESVSFHHFRFSVSGFRF